MKNLVLIFILIINSTHGVEFYIDKIQFKNENANKLLTTPEKEWYNAVMIACLECGRIEDDIRAALKIKDINQRTAALFVVGKWLMDYRAKDILIESYSYEQDENNKMLIISSFERLFEDLGKDTKTLESFKKIEKDHKIIKYINEAIEGIGGILEFIKKAKAEKIEDVNAKNDIMSDIKLKHGRAGKYKELINLTTINDEDSLRKLVPVIMRRQSDEAMYDIEKVYRIIMINRLIHFNVKDKK